jgi:hypothetical protein
MLTVFGIGSGSSQSGEHNDRMHDANPSTVHKANLFCGCGWCLDGKGEGSHWTGGRLHVVNLVSRESVKIGLHLQCLDVIYSVNW